MEESLLSTNQNCDLRILLSCVCYFPLTIPVTYGYLRYTKKKDLLNELKLWPWKFLLFFGFLLDIILLFYFPYDVETYIPRLIYNLFFLSIFHSLKFHFKHRQPTQSHHIKDKNMDFKPRVVNADIEPTTIWYYRMLHKKNIEGKSIRPEDHEETEKLEKTLFEETVGKNPSKRKGLVAWWALAISLYAIVWFFCYMSPFSDPLNPELQANSIVYLVRTIIVSSFIYWAILSNLLETKIVLLRRLALQEELYKLLSVNPKEEELVYHIDILDRKSINTWANLGKLWMNFGSTKIAKNEIYLIIILALYLLRVATYLIVSSFKHDNTPSLYFFWVAYGSFIIIQFFILGDIVRIDYRLRGKFQKNIKLLDRNIVIIKQILPLKLEDGVEPGNPFLKQIYIEVTTNVEQHSYEERRRDLLETLETAKEILEDVKSNERLPFLSTLLTFLFLLFPLFKEEVKEAIFGSFHGYLEIITFLLAAGYFIVYCFIRSRKH